MEEIDNRSERIDVNGREEKEAISVRKWEKRMYGKVNEEEGEKKNQNRGS